VGTLQECPHNVGTLPNSNRGVPKITIDLKLDEKILMLMLDIREKHNKLNQKEKRENVKM